MELFFNISVFIKYVWSEKKPFNKDFSCVPFNARVFLFQWIYLLLIIPTLPTIIYLRLPTTSTPKQLGRMKHRKRPSWRHFVALNALNKCTRPFYGPFFFVFHTFLRFMFLFRILVNYVLSLQYRHKFKCFGQNIVIQ